MGVKRQVLFFLLVWTTKTKGQQDLDVNVVISNANAAINQQGLQAALPTNMNQVQSYAETINSAQAACPPGYYCIGDVAPFIPCPPGTYQPLYTANQPSQCLPCPAGQYCLQASAMPTACAGGSYRSTANATQQADCTTCPIGSYCPSNATNFTQCPAGTYNSLTAQASFFSCIACPAGQYCPLGASNPSLCVAGTYRGGTNGTRQNDCTVCPSGNYCPLGSVNPTNCSAGTYRGGTDGIQQGDCTTCPSGNYCPQGSVTPTNCSAGTYNLLSNQTSSSSCLSCPAGDYCPIATTTPQLCSANTFSLASAPVCSVCPAYSTSPIASPNCTCDAGHTQTVVGGGGGTPAAVSYTVVGTDDYLSQRSFQSGSMVAGNLNYLTINGYTNVTVLKGTVLTLTMAPFKSVQSNLKLFYNTDPQKLAGDTYTVPETDPHYNSPRILDFANRFTGTSPITHASIAASLYTTGVTGSGTSTLVFDTSLATPGNYYLGSDGVVSKRVLTIQVQSPTPTTLTVPKANLYYSYLATVGDTLILYPYVGATLTAITIKCVPSADTDGSLATVAITGDYPLTLDTSSLSTDMQCYFVDDEQGVPFSFIHFKPRLPAIGSGGVSVLTCPNCSAGYRSSAGDQVCTACGLGNYSASVSASCTICPLGTMCNSTTTPAPVPCGVGYYQPSTGASFCIQCPVGQYCGSSTTVNPVNCSAGTYAPAMRASACTACALGKYSLTIGSSQDCPLCTANSYCASPTAIAICPLNTQSPAGSSSLLQCICMPGYQCTYTKRISLVITLTNVTQSAFQNNVNNVRTNLIKAIATAANVSEANVNITSFSPHVTSGGRRLLTAVHSSTHMGLHHHTMHHSRPAAGRAAVSKGVQMLTPSSKSSRQPIVSNPRKNTLMLDVFSDVHGAKHISNLNHHLASHKVPMHMWREVPQRK